MSPHHTVTAGPYTARLWLASDRRWKWHTWENGHRTLRSAADLPTAKKRAAEALRALRDGRAALLEADPATVSEFLTWRQQRLASPLAADAVTAYLQHLAERKVQETRILKSDLQKFAAAHPGRLATVTPGAISTYLAALPVGPRRQNNIRAHLVSLFRWARLHGHLPDTTTAPEKTIPARLETHEVQILTPDQFRALLQASPAEWRLPLAIGGLAGLRTEEIAGLRWEDLQLDQQRILVRAEICKTRRRRYVPIIESLAKWIAAAQPQPGRMVAPRIGLDALVKRLRRRGVEWVRNGLRHSFGSYRCAVVKSAGQVALEMGNSEAIVRRHYLQVSPEDISREWFAIIPTGSIEVTSPRKTKL